MRSNQGDFKKIAQNPHVWLCGLLLAAMVAGVYWRVGKNEFIVWDDPYYIYENPLVASGLSWLGVGWAFVTFTASNWHPLTWLSHMLDTTLFGPTPRAAHFVNLLWYAGCVLLAFAFFMRLRASFLMAFLMAAFWGAHPLHVESVAWAAERKDLLCAFFFLAAMISYLRCAEGEKRFSYGWTTAWFVLALLSKPMAVTWPCVALLMDYWPLQRLHLGWKKLLREKLPWFVLSAAVSLLTVVAQTKSDAVKTLLDFPLGDRIANALMAYGVYIRQTLWPFDLTVFYPYPYSISATGALVSFGVLCSVTGLVFIKRQRYPYLLWGWLFYLGALFPVIGIVQVGGHAHADRYMLIPQLGLIVGGGLFVEEVLTGKKTRRLAFAAAVTIIAVFCVLTLRQVASWKNSVTLFNQNLIAAGENETAHFHLGLSYLQSGRLDLAVTHFSAALQMNPRDVTTLNNLGVAYFRMNQADLAEECFRRAIAADPQAAAPHFHLGLLKYRQGLVQEAVKQMDQAVRLNPSWQEARILREKMLSSGLREPSRPVEK
ncbi:MAG TPA: tetratricopeptide repeat protein [Smithella sp.]|nr:tetratricopeptide repeat protein [Smithella sp.]